MNVHDSRWSRLLHPFRTASSWPITPSDHIYDGWLTSNMISWSHAGSMYVCVFSWSYFQDSRHHTVELVPYSIQAPPSLKHPVPLFLFLFLPLPLLALSSSPFFISNECLSSACLAWWGLCETAPHKRSRERYHARLSFHFPCEQKHRRREEKCIPDNTNEVQWKGE